MNPSLPYRHDDGTIGIALDFDDDEETRPLPSVLDAARAYTLLGWSVFLLAPGTKVPLRGTRGVHDATSDSAAIESQLLKTPNANLAIAAGASGLACVDVDPRNGGDVTMVETIRDRGPLGWSLSVCTWSGGTHYYFTTDRTIASGAHRYGKGIDSKSADGYLVAPPSVIDGEPYRWRTDGATLAPLSGWALRMASAPTDEPVKPQPLSLSGRWGREDDLRSRIERSISYVDRMPEAVSGAGGHDALWDVALVLVRGFELPDAVAAEVAVHYSQRCSPPWSQREIEHKIQQAKRSRRAPGYLLGEDA